MFVSLRSWPRLTLASMLLNIPALAGGSDQDVPQYSAREFYETTSISGASFSADETRVLFSSDADGVFNAYSRPVLAGEPSQLTFSKSDAVFAVSYFPQDDRILFTRDAGGNELNHVFVRLVDGTERDLTPGEELKASFAGWSDDLSSFYIATNERDSGFFDLYRYRSETYERERVFENKAGFGPPSIGRSDRWVVAAKINNNRDTDIYVWDRNHPDREPLNITPDDTDVENQLAAIAPDSGSIYYLSNRDSEFQRVWQYDLQSRQHSLVWGGRWDVWFVTFSWDGRYRAIGSNEDAHTVVTITDTKTGQVVNMPAFTGASVTSVNFSRSGKQMAFYVKGDRSPSNLYVMDLATGDHRRLTDSLNPKVSSDHLVDSTVVRYASFDGLEIPAILYRPHQAKPDKPVPALVWVHGGPGGQCRVGYRAELQFLVNHGYAILAVNNRGSSGYGKTFHHMDDRKHGEVDLQDVVYGRKYLESFDWVDDSRIGIIGGSYGGYMVCAALAFQPQVFDVGIDIFGVTNWLRTLKSIPPWWESFRDALYDEMGDPTTDAERLHRISPLFHAKNIERPLLVIQGANDPRVLQVESDEMVAAVREKGVFVQYVVFPDEGHGFRRRENRITAAEAYLKFLDQQLAK